MTGLLHDVARAALPVATALLVVAVAARVALWADLDDERLTHTAREYLAPLTTWCLGAVAVYAVALGGAGEAGVLSLALAGGIGAAAVVLRVPDEFNRPEETGSGGKPQPVAADARRGRATSAPAGRPADARAAESSSRAATRPWGAHEDASRAKTHPLGAAADASRAKTHPLGAAADASRAKTRPLGDDLAAARAGGGLWLEPEEDTARTGLWSR
jgi:hypothetical protein